MQSMSAESFHADDTTVTLSPQKGGVKAKQSIFSLSPHDHPDTILRKLGVIRQKVTFSKGFGKRYARYDPSVEKWIDQETNEEHLSDPSRGNGDYIDTVPGGVILVAGELESESANPYDCTVTELQELEALLKVKFSGENESLEKCRKRVQGIIERKRSSEDFDDQQLLITNLGDEQDGKFLNDAEVQQYVRQYVVRSIPSAAVDVGAVVMTASSSDGKLVSLLSQGIGVASSTHDVNALHITEKLSANRTTFATVAKFGGLSDPVDLAFLADSMAIELNKGSTSSRDDHPGRFLNVHPPTRRKAIPVTVIAFGGVNEKTCNALKMQLYVASLRQWPIFLVEGSGGLTDDIVKILRTLRDPSVSQERQETLRHKLDSQTFEIINNGKLFVVGKGQIVDAFSSSLKFSIRGDSTLLHAWKEYGAWNGAGEEYRFIYESLLLLLVTLGVFSTGLSVFQTVMQVVWVNETKDNSNATVVGRVYSGLNLVVIFLPLLIQLMQSVFNKINSGPKWAALSWAAENCLREIYLARVQGMEYSSASLEALSQVKVDGELRRSGRVVTRQELLSKQLEKLSKELRLNVANTLIRPYSQEESIPPKEMRFLGDDGMSDLSSDDYVRLRIVPRLEMYKREVVHVSNVRVLLETCLHLFNTAGTVLGALATYEFLPNTNLQAWVAFTTSVVSALTRVEHWMLYEWKQRKYTQTYMKLASVMSWWSSRGKQVASEKVMSELCTRAEAAIKEELAEFSQQLRTAADSIKKAKELYGEKDSSEMLQDLLSGINSLGGDRSGKDQSKREMMRFVKELPLELITAENIEAAASDPSSFIGRQMKQLLNELNHEFGDVVGAHQRRVDELRAKVEQFLEVASSFRDIQHLVTDGLGCISMPSIDNLTRFGFAKLLSRPLRDLIETPHKRTRYLAALEASLEESGGVLRLQQLRDAASSVDRDCVRPEMSAIPARLLLETARLALQEEAASQFSEALASAGISPQEITPRRGKLADTIQALRPLSFLPWRVMESSEILLLIDDNKVRSTLKNNVSESKLRSLLKRIESFYRIHSHSLAVEADVLNEAVMMDMYNEILGTPEGRIISSSMRAQMRDLTVSPTLLSQMDLVRIFADSESGAIPDEGVNALGAQSIIASISRHVGDLSQSVLAEYVRVLSRDLPANSCLVAAAWYSAAALRSPFMKSIDAFTNAGFAFIRSVEPIFVVSKRIDQLASFALSVSQSEILQSRKEQLLKRLLGSTGAKDLVDILRTVEGDGLKQLLCATHSLMGVSYVGEIFDHLSFEMHTFDPARALNYEEKILLLSRLNEFARDDIIQIMSKEDILNRLALKPLNRKLKDLKDYQLRDLMIRLRTSMFPLFAEALKTRFVNLIASKSREVRSRAELMGPLHFYILAHCLGRIDVATFLFLESYTKSQFHGMFGDPQPKRSEWLRIIPDSNVQQTVVDLDLNFDEIKEFCRESAKYCEDSILLEALERFAIDFADDSDMVDALEVAFGSNVDGQQSRDCFFASLVVLVANGFTSLTVVEAMSKVASNELLSSVQKILDQSQLVEKLDEDGNAVTVINAREILQPEHRPQFQGSESRFRQRMKDIHKRVNIALSERYPVFLSSMLSSVMVQCTMFVFNEVARIHKNQDLRQVFDKLHARVHLPFFAICRWDLIISVINISQHPKRDEEALEKALKEVLRSPTQAIKKGTTPSTVPLSDLSPRRSEAKSQGAEEFSEMERTIDDLREMPRDDTIQVLQILMSVLTKTRIGNLFYLLAKSDVSVVGESHPVFSLREIVTSQLLGVANAITPQVAIHKAELYEKFCAFKEKSFAAKSPASKEDVFKAFVFDDSLAKHAATSWEESTLCEFFAYMRTRAKFIRETVSSSGQVRVVDQYVTHRADLVSQEREQQGSLLKTAKRITTTLVSLSRIVSHKNDLVQAPSLMAAKTETVEPAENSGNEVYSPAALLDQMIGRVPDPSM